MWGRFIALSGFYLATSLSSVSASEATALIDLDEAFARTLERNPALVIAGYQIDARRGSSLQAGLRPNPELDVTVEDVFGSGVFDGFDSAEVTLRLGWVLERGKRQRRVAAAEAGLSLAEVDMDIDRLDAVAATARYFLDSIAYQTRLERIESAIALAERTVSAVGERVQAGRSPDADLARAEADLARIRLS
nr:TolC family protein [Gammaproteobacteria bacterium]